MFNLANELETQIANMRNQARIQYEDIRIKQAEADLLVRQANTLERLIDKNKEAQDKAKPLLGKLS